MVLGWVWFRYLNVLLISAFLSQYPSFVVVMGCYELQLSCVSYPWTTGLVTVASLISHLLTDRREICPRQAVPAGCVGGWLRLLSSSSVPWFSLTPQLTMTTTKGKGVLVSSIDEERPRGITG
jgi:hypothetical protein